MAFKVISGGMKLGGTATLEPEEPKFKVISGGMTTPSLTTAAKERQPKFKGVSTPTTIPKFNGKPIPEIRALTSQDRKSSALKIPDSKVFEKQVELITDKIFTGHTGIKPEQAIKAEENLGSMMARAPLVGMGFASPVVAAGFEGLNQLKNAIVSKVKREKFEPIKQRMLSELIPKTVPTPIKVGANIAENVADIALMSGATNLAKQKLLENTLKTVGNKMSAAGYGTSKLEIPKENIIEAAKASTPEQEINRFIKAKQAKFPNVPMEPVRPFTGQPVPAGRKLMPIVPKAPVFSVPTQAKPIIKPELATQPIAGGMIHETPPQVQKWLDKGVTIAERQAPIRIIDPEAKIKDINGVVVDLPKGHEMTPYKLSNGKIWLHDGKNVVVESGQLQNLANKNLVLGEKNIPAEEQGIEEVVKVNETKNYTINDVEYQGIEDKNGVKFHIVKVPDNVLQLPVTQYPTRTSALERALQKTQGYDKTKFSQYQLPGGENYREVLFKAPTKSKLPHGNIEELSNGKFRVSAPGLQDKLFDTEQEAIEETKNLGETFSPQEGFKSSHWDEPNVLSHARINDRITPDGKKILFVEEIQSDWARSGREKGFIKNDLPEGFTVKTVSGRGSYVADGAGNSVTSWSNTPELAIKDYFANINSSAVPSHPLLKSWQEFTLKQILKKAIKEGYDGIAWTTGEQQAARYDLSKQVDDVIIKPAANKFQGKYFVEAFRGSKSVIAKFAKTDIELEQLVGKDLAHKAIKDKADLKEQNYQGEDLKIGGEWAKNLYDKQIPNILKDLTKGVVGNVNLGKESADVDLAGEPLHGERNLIQPALIFIPETKARVVGSQPMAGGIAFDKRKELMQKRLEEVALAKEELQSLNEIRSKLRGRIQKYKGGYLAEELGGIPKFYITNSGGSKPDEIIGEINSSNLGVELQNENELKDWLKGLEDRRRELIGRIESNRPQLEAHKENTLLAQEEKIRQQERVFAGKEMAKLSKEQANITAKLEKRAFREGRQLGAEQRKVAYFGEQISKQERSKLYLLAKEKGLYYTDFTGSKHDKLARLLKYYRGASFDQLREYISNLTGDPENPPKLLKLYGDINKDTEVIKLIKEASKDWVDINKVEVHTLDPVRIVEKATQQDLWNDNILADNTFLVYAAADEAMYGRLVQELNSLDNNRQGISKGSKESSEIMRKFEVGEMLTEKEKEVVNYLRSKYDSLISEANEMRMRLGKRPIPYRQDYMTHIKEQNLLSDFFKGDFDQMKNISPAQLDAIRKGDYTKGNMPFNRFALKRTGPKTKFDAIGNYEIYLRTILKEIYYTPAITHVRKFSEYALVRQPNAWMALDRLANDLKGKPSIQDKWVGGMIASNPIIRKIRSLQAKSALLANINFWVMNASNFAISYDELGNYMNKGMAKFLGTKQWRQFAFKQSNLMKGRTIDPDIDPGTFKTIEEVAGYITNLLEYNNVGSTFIGAYFKGIDLGYNQAKAIKYADSIARRTQVGYKKYELNAWMRSNSGMLLSQFQTWTFAMMNHIIYDLKLGNIPGKFTGKTKKPTRWGALFTLVAISMLMNLLYKKAGLREPYGPESAMPRIPGIGGAVPPLVRIGQNIATVFAGKKPETKQKAAIRAVTSFIPMGGQVSRFLSGRVFPQNPNEPKDTQVKFPSKFKSKFPAKFKSKF